jgi:hypothetical protein
MLKDDSSSKPILIYFDGCPNADKTKRRLRDAHIDFVDQKQDSLPNGHAHLNYSSPTLLLGDQIIFGETTTEGGAGGCSLDLPESEEIRERLNAILRGRLN